MFAKALCTQDTQKVVSMAKRNHICITAYYHTTGLIHLGAKPRADNLGLDCDVITWQEPKCWLILSHIDASRFLSLAYDKESQHYQDRKSQLQHQTDENNVGRQIHSTSTWANRYGVWNWVTYHLSILGSVYWQRVRCLHYVTRFVVFMTLFLIKMFGIRLIGWTKKCDWLDAARMNQSCGNQLTGS